MKLLEEISETSDKLGIWREWGNKANKRNNSSEQVEHKRLKCDR